MMMAPSSVDLDAKIIVILNHQDQTKMAPGDVEEGKLEDFISTQSM
jgi:hypothetical protein